VTQQAERSSEVTVVLVSGACCFPPLKAFDDQARRIVDAAIATTGVPTRVVSMSSSQAYYGGLPKAIAEAGKNKKDELGISMFPVVLVNLEPVSYGVPTLEAVVAALNKAASATGVAAATSPTGVPR
jgi:hypothetical protein